MSTAAPAPVEFLYGIEPGHYDGADVWQPARVVAFRVTKKTARRIYYDANLLTGHHSQVRYVDRQVIEAAGEVTRRSGHWWEPDLTVYAKAPQTWPPQQNLNLSQLKAAMAAAHPDRGGSHEGFIAARSEYERALSREAS